MSSPLRKLPPTRPLRGPQPWLKRLLHPLAAPFTDLLGGPLFDDSRQLHVDCGPAEVTFFLPRAYFGSSAFPDIVDSNDDAVFGDPEGNCRTRHRKIDLGISNWNYWCPRLDPHRLLPIPHEPYVIITAYWQLERVRHDQRLEIGNTAALETYLRNDYEDFLEGEGGINWKIRKRENEYLLDDDREFMKETVKERIDYQLLDAPDVYEPMMFNGTEWLRYAWAVYRRRGIPFTALNYTTVLAPRTLLTVCFDATHMYGTPETDAKWVQALKEDSVLLMEGVKLRFKALPPA